MKAKTLGLVAASAAVALTAAACGGTPVNSKGASAGSAPGWDPSSKTLTITSLYPESGPVAGGALFLVGMKAWFNRATSSGGELAGYKIKMNTPDTQYQDALTVSEYQQYKSKSALFEVLGSPTQLPLKQDNILAVGAGLDSTLIQDPNYLPVLPPNQVIAANMVAYADQVEGKKDSTYCVVKENDANGEQFLQGAKYATDQLGLKFGTTVPFTYPMSDATPVVVQLRKAGCDEVVVGGVTPTMIDLAARAAQLDYAPQWLVTGSGVSPHMATGPSGEYIQKHVLMVYTGADWGSDEVPGSKQLAHDVAAVNPKAVPDAVSYESGYCEGMATTAVLKKALDNGDMTRQGILDAVNQLGKLDLLGLCGGDYDYGTSPQTRVPPKKVTVYKFVPNTSTGLKMVKLDYSSKVGDSAPLAH